MDGWLGGNDWMREFVKGFVWYGERGGGGVFCLFVNRCEGGEMSVA
jgi:hypothetical protein